MTPHGGVWLPFLLCAAACSFAPPRRIYLLTPPIVATAATTTRPAPDGEAIAPTQRLELRRLLVPDYLDTTDMLMRSGSDEVKASATGRWGERLSVGLTRALDADLAVRLPRYSIVEDASSNPQRRLRITITALDLWPNGHCVLAANWSIADQDSSIPVTTGSTTIDSSSVVAAMTATDAIVVEGLVRTLGKLADSIVLDVTQQAPGAPTCSALRRC